MKLLIQAITIAILYISLSYFIHSILMGKEGFEFILRPTAIIVPLFVGAWLGDYIHRLIFVKDD